LQLLLRRQAAAAWQPNCCASANTIVAAAGAQEAPNAAAVAAAGGGTCCWHCRGPTLVSGVCGAQQAQQVEGIQLEVPQVLQACRGACSEAIQAIRR
jgi:hypothetical protein